MANPRPSGLLAPTLLTAQMLCCATSQEIPQISPSLCARDALSAPLHILGTRLWDGDWCEQEPQAHSSTKHEGGTCPSRHQSILLIFSKDEKLLSPQPFVKKKYTKSFPCDGKAWNRFIFNVFYLISREDQERRNLAINTPANGDK